MENWKPGWQDRAACADLPWTLFFAEDTTRRNPYAERRLPGVLVCQTCPVRNQCLEYALETNTKAGIFGGKTSGERARIRKQRRLGLVSS